MMRVNLFISNFKKYWKVIVTGIAFLIVLSLCNRILWYLLIDDTGSYTRIAMYELYHQEQNVDVLVLGSSHAYRSLDPRVMDKIFETNTFNAGSSSQSLDGSYTLLVEAGKQYDLKKVYLEMYYGMMGNNYEERTQMTHTYIISDYMKPSINRVRYLISASNWDHWINGFFPARRNWKKLFERQYVSNLIAKKSEDSYKNYEYVRHGKTDEYYVGKGYVASNKGKEDGNFARSGGFESAQRTFSEDDIKSLEKIIKYCQKHDIELVFFSSPISDFQLAEIGDYDTYVQYVKDFCAKHNLSYYDFSLCKEERFFYDSKFFKDPGHLNGEGAEIFSRIFAEFFTGKIPAEDLFYASYEEKMKSVQNHFYGLIYGIETIGSDKKVTFEAVQNRKFDFYVSVSKRVKGTKQYEEVQGLGPLQEIVLPAEETGRLRIRVFSDGRGENMTNEIGISY